MNPELSDELKRPYGKSKTGGLYMAGLAVKRLGGTLDYMCIEQGASFIVTLPTGKKKVSLND
ncbi:ATP-binding protein [Oceanospirillum maris]|uniref:ATP-binding protein n=1 Tax=Oceanospirillum maris TaxID=64977 RepID=UPI000410AF4F|nr:ATP-binding protein [Oceanospirillum maris]